MSVHFKKKCYSVDEINCEVPCNTKHNKIQPHIVMQGFCKEVLLGGVIVGKKTINIATII